MIVMPHIGNDLCIMEQYLKNLSERIRIFFFLTIPPVLRHKINLVLTNFFVPIHNSKVSRVPALSKEEVY